MRSPFSTLPTQIMYAPRLSIVVPVFNEERTLESIMDRIYAACGNFAEVIYVDDGSQDRSLEILKYKARTQDTIITKRNGGKGSAVRRGYETAKGTYTIVQDADLEYSPEEIPALLAFAEQGDHSAVFGSRRLRGQKIFAHFAAFVGGSLLTMACNLLYRTKLTDQPTCYKLVRTDILKTFALRENDFRFEPEITALLARTGVPIAEYPISYTPRSWNEGKKIGWRDWFLWMWAFLKYRVLPLRKRMTH
jgi:glycosyltransferase involved in cell wall biosynthesis